MQTRQSNKVMRLLKIMDIQRPSCLRRLAAMLYDALITLALLILGTLLISPLAANNHFSPNNHYFQSYLMLLIIVSYVGFWVHSGQTLGMLAWRIKVQNRQAQALNLAQACLRFVCAAISLSCFGLGLLWQLVDEDR